MLRIAICILLIAQYASVFSQNEPIEQPSQPFPFSVSLLNSDSIGKGSNEIFLKKNKATLIAFWLTTCVPCSFELDEYAKNYANWQKEYDLRIVAVSMDFPERFKKIGERVREKAYPFDVWWDPWRSFKQIMPGGLNGYPQVFLFDSKGELVWKHKGYSSAVTVEMLEVVKKLDQD